MSNEKLLINNPKSNNSEDMSNKRIEKMACDMCVVKHICNEPNKPIATCYALKCAKRAYEAGYRKQSEGEWSRFEVNSTKGYGQVYYQHKDCDINATQLFPSPYHFCPNCGAKMKGGAE